MVTLTLDQNNDKLALLHIMATTKNFTGILFVGLIT